MLSLLLQKGLQKQLGRKLPCPLILLIIVFMTSFGKINNISTKSSKYEHLILVFLQNKNMLDFNEKEFLAFCSEYVWKSDFLAYSYSILMDINSLVKNSQLYTDRLIYFDQTASGPSIIAICSNSEFLATQTNLISLELQKNFNQINFDLIDRNCVYTTYLNHLIKNYPEFASYNFDRPWAKYIYMAYNYGSGGLSISNTTVDWTEENVFSTFLEEPVPAELMSKYETFFNKRSKHIKAIQDSLETFCPKATSLKTWFNKVALILISDEVYFDKLSKKKKAIILDFRIKLEKAGFKKESEKFFGFGKNNLSIVTATDSEIQYFLTTLPTKLTKIKTYYKEFIQSFFDSFQMRKGTKLDRDKMINSFYVHFIHGMDASIIKMYLDCFYTKFGMCSTSVVHDSFSVTLDKVSAAQNLVKDAYYKLKFDDHVNLINKCIINPNFNNGGSMLKSAGEILLTEYEQLFPRADNILLKYRKSVTRGFYWFPISD